MFKKDYEEKPLITKELLDRIEQLGEDRNLDELNRLNEQYLNYFYNGFEDSKSSLIDLSEYIDVVSEPLRTVKIIRQHSPASYFKKQILDDISK
jgi:hypothetical protein